MSLILKGIDLPIGKDEALLLLVLGDGTVAEKISSNKYEEITDAEAIQIPKGARLIDANKLEIHEIVNNPILRDFDYVYADDIEDAPTILESEDKE